MKSEKQIKYFEFKLGRTMSIPTEEFKASFRFWPSYEEMDDVFLKTLTRNKKVTFKIKEMEELESGKKNGALLCSVFFEHYPYILREDWHSLVIDYDYHKEGTVIAFPDVSIRD